MNNGNTNRRTSTTGRDLRFAGTLAAGLVAGVLGVGAIAVPLVGWNDWPQALSTSSGDAIEISTATDRSGPRRDSGSSGSEGNAPRVTVTGPSGALALLPAANGTATGGSTTSAQPSGAGSTGATGATGGDSPTVRRSRSGSQGDGDASGGFEAGQDFAEEADSDGDGIPDSYEQAQ